MIDFDKLASQAARPDSTMEDKNALWSATFDLPEWHCIARGTFPDVYPYTTSLEDGKVVMLIFTDSDRARTYASKNAASSASESVPLLGLPSNTAPDYFIKFAERGVWGVWFNAGEMGYYAPLEGLPRIKAHLEKLKQG